MHKKIKLFTFLFIPVFVFISCKSENIGKTTSSGYDYVHHIIMGGALPEVGDYVVFEMQVLGDSGVVLRNMRDLPNMPSFQILDPKIPHYRLNPLNEMLSNMSKGDSATLCYPIDSFSTIPQQLKGNENIFYSVIIRDIKTRETFLADLKKEKDLRKLEMAEVKAMEPFMKDKAQGILNNYKEGELDNQIVTTESGLKYIIHEKGTGPLPVDGSSVSVNYYGVLMDGTPIDNSYKLGNAYEFVLGAGKVIAGWEESMRLFNKGTKATLIIPYTLGYGVAGKDGIVPEKADLLFYIELENFFNY